MSSTYVRDQVKSFIASNSAEKVMDLSGVFDELNKALAKNTPSISPEEDWIGLQFIPGDEIPVGLPADNSQGRYREDGAIFIHVVAPAKVGASNGLQTRTEALRTLFRGQRIGTIKINSVTPPSYDNGATLQFEGGWMSASFLIDFERDFVLT